jgi:hypothetical protein
MNAKKETKGRLRKRKKPDITGIREDENQDQVIPLPPLPLNRLTSQPETESEASTDQNPPNFLSKKFLQKWRNDLPDIEDLGLVKEMNKEMIKESDKEMNQEHKSENGVD